MTSNVCSRCVQGGKGAADRRSSGGYIAAVWVPSYSCGMAMGSGATASGMGGFTVHHFGHGIWGRYTMRQSDPVHYSGE
jgi:hypothetical protein